MTDRERRERMDKKENDKISFDERAKYFCDTYTLEELAKKCAIQEFNNAELLEWVKELSHEDFEDEAETCSCEAENAYDYEKAYMDSCIRINQLNVTIDVLVDKLSKLREVSGLRW